MPFSQASILEEPTVYDAGTEIVLSWHSSAPVGTVFQVYRDLVLAWSGTARDVVLAKPTRPCLFHVGTVAAGEQRTDFSGSLALPSGTGDRVTIAWNSGTYQVADLAGFKVYGEPTPGAGIDYATVLADIAAYPNGEPADGWDLGPWDVGPWESGVGEWSWSSGPLTSGTWHFAVKAYDAAGALGTAQTWTAVVSAPPAAPLPYGDGHYIHYTYNSGTHVAALSWNASTG